MFHCIERSQHVFTCQNEKKIVSVVTAGEEPVITLGIPTMSSEVGYFGHDPRTLSLQRLKAGTHLEFSFRFWIHSSHCQIGTAGFLLPSLAVCLFTAARFFNKTSNQVQAPPYSLDTGRYHLHSISHYTNAFKGLSSLEEGDSITSLGFFIYCSMAFPIRMPSNNFPVF